MPVDVAAGFAADGWAVTEVDGHDTAALYAACAAARVDGTRPHAILAHTTIGRASPSWRTTPSSTGAG